MGTGQRVQAWSGPPPPTMQGPAAPLCPPVPPGRKRFGCGDWGREKSVQSEATGVAPSSWGSHAGAGEGASQALGRGEQAPSPSSSGLRGMGDTAKTVFPSPRYLAHRSFQGEAPSVYDSCPAGNETACDAGARQGN